MLIALVLPLALATVFYAVTLLRAVIARHVRPGGEATALGAVTNFFDTLGIGCFAPTMAWFKFRRMVPDRLIPCTLLVGHSLPTMVQAVIFLIILGVSVEPVLLVGCVAAVLAGALVGVPLVARARVDVVQTVVGIALIIAAGLYALTNLHLMPGGGTAASLPPPLMIAAIGANFVFGILLNFGIGNYAPTLAMLSLMGMDPRLVFPIMAAGAAAAMGGSGLGHIARGEVDLRIALGLTVGGIPAVLVAAFLVKSMPLDLLRWLVIVVVLYAAFAMLRSAAAGRRNAAAVAEVT
ncbi:MAG: permease [Phenylobacterium zucineum]|nr:MAG: permease [Phenylobacterium zucineum]